MEDSEHLSAGEQAAYLDRRLTPAERSRIEEHLASCPACRAVLVEAGRSLRGYRVVRVRRAVIPVAVAAALVALLVIPRLPQGDLGPSPSREPAGLGEQAPAALAPVGRVGQVERLRWSAIHEADRYRITLFDSSATVLWQGETTDTVAGLPDSVRLVPGQAYYWRVEARIAWDRWLSSPLVSFTPAPDQAQ